MAFDVEGALRAGYTLPEIAEHLGQQKKFDVTGARQAGYSDSELVRHLMGGAQGPKTGFFANLGAGYESFKGDVGSIGAAMNVPGAEAFSRKQQQLASEKATIPEFSDIAGVGDAYNYVSGLAGRAVPYMVAPIAAAVSAPAGIAAAAAGTAAGAIQFFGTDLTRQLQEGKTAETLDIASAAAAAPFQAALDTVGFRYIPGLRKIFGQAGVKMSDDALRNLMKARTTENLASKVINYGAKAVQTAGVEGLTESAQQVLERAQAGLAIDDPEARKEYFDSFIGGAVLGGTLAVPGTAIERSSQQGQYEQLLRKDAAAAAAAKQPVTEAAPADSMGFKPTPVLPDTYAEAVQEVERLKQETQTAEIKARIAELETYKQRLLTEDIEGLRRDPYKKPDTLQDQIKNQSAVQGEFRETTADLKDYFTPEPRKDIPVVYPDGKKGVITPEQQRASREGQAEEVPKEAPTVLDANTLNATGLPKQSGIYKQLLGKDLTDLEGLDAVMQIVERAKTNNSLSPATRQALDSLATNAFNIYGKQAEMFGPRGGVLEPIKPEKVTAVQQKIDEVTKDKDLTDPAQVEEIRAILTDYANAPNRSAEAIAELTKFLDTLPSSAPEATDVLKPTEPIDATGQPSPAMAGKPKKSSPRGTTALDVTGVDDTGAAIGQPDVGTPVQPTALTETPTAPLTPARTIPPVAPLPVPNAPIAPNAPTRTIEPTAPTATPNAPIAPNVPTRTIEPTTPIGAPNVPTAPNAPPATQNAGVPALVEPPPQDRVSRNDAITQLMASGLKRSDATKFVNDVADTYDGTVALEDLSNVIEGDVREVPEAGAVAKGRAQGKGRAKAAALEDSSNVIEGQVRVIDEGTIAPAVLQLSSPEQQKLAEHYGEPVNSQAFLEKLRKDISDFATKGAQAVDKAIRNIIRKLNAAVLAAAVIMNPNYMSAPVPVAIPKTVTTIEQVKAVVPAEVAKNMSPSAQMAFANIFPAIQADLKAKNKFFVLTDKPNARVFIFDPNGKPILDKKVLVGKTMGDFYKGNTDIVSNRITPAGLFTLGLRNAARGGGEAVTAGHYDFGKVFVLDKAIDGEYSITLFHSVWTHEKDASKRLAALKKESAEDSRYSFGCINVDKESYGMLVNKYESQMDGAKMFVVPDNPDATMDFINGAAVNAGDLTRQAVQPVTKEVTKTVPGTPSTTSERTQQVAARKEEGLAEPERRIKGLYRLGETPAPGEGMGQAQVQTIVDTMSKNWENAPKINVVQDIQELPQDIYQQMVKDNALDAPGVYDPNTKIVHLISDNIKNPKEAMLTLAHEALGHYGLQSILGHTYNKVMDDIYAGNAKVRELADVKVKKGLDQRTAVEEVLAEMAEKDVNNSAVQRVINAIRQWLRKMGVPFGTVSDTEIRALLANANRFVHGGKFRAGEEAFGNKPLYKEGAFQKWFGNSVVRNENGTPKVMYHGTSQDIHEFRPKQAGAIFVTDNPNFAHSFAEMSEGYMMAYAKQNMPEAELNDIRGRAQKIADKEGTSFADELFTLLKESLPSNANIMPVYVSAQNPFDYDNKAHIEELSKQVSLMGEDRMDVRRGSWGAIESKRIQAAIKAAGFDGFYVMEGGKKNLAVYEPTQIKSIFNKGTYDPADKRILYRSREEELTPAGKEAADLNDRMKGAGNPNPTDPDSILKKTLGVIQTREGEPSLGTRFRREYVDARATAVEKMEAKFNNTLTDSLGELRGDLTQIQAQDHAAFAEGTMEHGGIQIGKDKLVEIVDRDATMGKVFDIMIKLGDRLGSLKTAMQLGHNAFIAQRAKELNAHNAKIAQDIVAAEAKGNKKAVAKLQDQLITHYVTDEEIAAADEAMQKFPELKEAFKTFTEYKNNLIDFLVQTGRINEAKANEWKEAAGYVPWTRVEEEVNIFDENPASFKGGIASISKLRILDRNGSQKEIANVFDNMIGLTSWAVKTGMNAYASRRMAESLPDAFELTTPEAVADAQKYKKDRLIFTYKDGERTAYMLGSALDKSAFASNVVTLTPVLKGFSFAQSTLRSFVTHMPAFALSQLIQDGTYRAMLLSGVKHPFSLPAKVAKNFIHAMAGEGIPLELARIGVSGVYDGMPQHAIDRARVKYGLEERGAFKKAWDKLEKFSLAADLAVRAAIYEQTLNETKSAEMPEGDRKLALYRAKEYINFKHAGDSTVIGTLRHMVPFLNAYIQGMDILVRTMRGKGISLEDKRTAQKLFLATGLKLAAMSTLYAMLVGDDDDYKGMEDYERDKNYIIPGTGLKIPVAPEVGFMFKVIPERIVRYVISQGTERPQDATAFYKGFKDAFIAAYSGTNLTPQLVKPGVEVLTNYSFFTGNPIVGAGMKNLDPSMQFTEGTSELAKLFGMVGISPMKADYLIRGYTGMLGAFVLDATDAVANPDRMGKPVSKLPQLSTFMYDTTGRGYKSEFYSFRESVDQVVDTVNMFKREGRMEELRNYMTEENMKLYAMKGIVNKAETQLANLRKYRNIISHDPQMPADLKREKTDEILKQEKELLLAYNLPKLRGMAGM
jgi:hypothetical protein